MLVSVSVGILIARLLVGGSLAAHGAQKLFGWFGGHGPTGTGAFFEQLGFRPGTLFAVAAGLGEFVGGILTLLGLLGATGPALIVLVMLVAIFTVHISKGFFAASGGWELPAMNIAAVLGIAFATNGIYSLDAVLGVHFLTNPAHVWMALVAAIVLALLSIVARRPAAAPSSS
ncbi:MAG: DoxX family protein [Candidatus Tyrphobacter sp.]